MRVSFSAFVTPRLSGTQVRMEFATDSIRDDSGSVQKGFAPEVRKVQIYTTGAHAQDIIWREREVQPNAGRSRYGALEGTAAT